MVERVLSTIKKHNLIDSSDTVIVGLSGGPDSVCLLHILYSLRDELNIVLSAVHINHGLRGKESDLDEEFTVELCKKLGINLFVRSFDIEAVSRKEGLSLEEAGRKIRYEQFQRIADETGASKIAVAHNRNDQAETVLMNIIRGTGLDGLKGMDLKRGRIIRPLLHIRRKEIEDYCIEKGLNPRIDSSNLNSVYTRNRVRLELVPYIEGMFGTDIVESICRMAELVSNDKDYIDGIITREYRKLLVKRDSEGLELDLLGLKSCHPAAAGRIIRHAFREVKGDLRNLQDVHVSSVMQLVLGGRTGALIQLPANISVLKSYNTLNMGFIREKHSVKNYEEKIIIPGITRPSESGKYLEASFISALDVLPGYADVNPRSKVQFFDYDTLYTGIYIRNRRNGDVFKPYKSNGTRKLKEYFIDEKVPRDKRDEIPLIAAGGEIVWIIGNKISDKFKVTENTKRVVKLEYFPGDNI